MKTALALLCVVGLAFGAGAQSYFVGVEIVPHSLPGTPSSIGRPYLMLGYDAGWLISGIGTNTPLSLGVSGTGNLSDGWYMAYAGPAFTISPVFRGFGGLAFWLRMANFTAVNGRWSAWAGLNWRVGQHNVYDWGVEFSAYTKAHLPLEVVAGSTWFGAWFSVGVNVGISPPRGP